MYHSLSINNVHYSTKMRLISKKRSRHVLRLVAVSLLICLAYTLGLFTHLFEKSLAEFRYPIRVDIHIAMKIYSPTKPVNASTTSSINDENEIGLRYLHKPAIKCDSSTFLTILVKSKLDYFERREAIRSSWAQSSQPRIRAFFLIGHSTSGTHIGDKFEREVTKYGDIIQQDFEDVYYNNTLKTIMGIRWAAEECGNSRFYLFIDDDFYLNPRLLISHLSQPFDQTTLDKFYAGFVYPNSSPMRHMLSKWYLSLDDYPYDKFPPYVSAGCYILSQQSLRLFYVGTKLIKRFKFDDIYMGILAYLLEVKPEHMKSVYYDAPSYFPSLYANEIVAAHGFEANELIRIWNQLEMHIKYNE